MPWFPVTLAYGHTVFNSYSVILEEVEPKGHAFALGNEVIEDHYSAIVKEILVIVGDIDFYAFSFFCADQMFGFGISGTNMSVGVVDMEILADPLREILPTVLVGVFLRRWNTEEDWLGAVSSETIVLKSTRN